MKKTWILAAGSLKGWLITLGLWAFVLLVYLAVHYSRGSGRSRVRLDPKLADIISIRVPLEPITGGMDEPGNAAEDYHKAVVECIADDYYKHVPPISKLLKLKPEQFPLRAPDCVLAGARKQQMQYTDNYCQAIDWTSRRFPHYKAFELISRYCLVKEKMLVEAGQTDEAEALLKALMVFGYQIQQERVRLQGILTGLGIQSQAGGTLLQLYKQSKQEEKAKAVQAYLAALREVQERVDAKAGKTVSRLDVDSPPTAELMWVVENDRDRMWRIEAALTLGLTKWTAPRTADRDASREKLQQLQQDPDPLVREAAAAGLAISPEDVRKVR